MARKLTSPKSKTPSKSASSRDGPSRFRRALRRAGVLGAWAVLLVGVGLGVVAGFDAMERYVLAQRGGIAPVRYQVELVDLPKWLPPTLNRLILSQVTPEGLAFEDETLCETVHRLAEQCPWIGEVAEVRRVRLGVKRGAVRVHAHYRRPIARIRYQQRTHYVDADGVVLPYEQVPKWATRVDGHVRYFVYPDAVPAGLVPMPIHFILIDGVATCPPVQGEPWQADDLRAGLRLVRLVQGKPYASQITVVDVRNFRERVSSMEPELRMYAQQGRSRPTDIRFGRFPHPDGGDWVISPDRKLRYLDEYVADHAGRLAGNHEYIDVRFDELRVSMN